MRKKEDYCFYEAASLCVTFSGIGRSDHGSTVDAQPPPPQANWESGDQCLSSEYGDVRRHEGGNVVGGWVQVV